MIDRSWFVRTGTLAAYVKSKTPQDAANKALRLYMKPSDRLGLLMTIHPILKDGTIVNDEAKVWCIWTQDVAEKAQIKLKRTDTKFPK